MDKLSALLHYIVKCQKEQAILLGEMLLFLSSISKNKESFDKVDQCTNESLSLYVSIQEKYTTKFNDIFHNFIFIFNK